MADTDLAQEEEVNALAAAAAGKPGKGRLEIAIQKDRNIPELSSEFAKAHAALGNFPGAPQGAYALIFNSNFPARMEAIDTLLEEDIPHLQKVINAGTIAATGGEHYAVVLEKPFALTLDQHVTAPLPDVQAYRIIEKIAGAMLALHNAGIVHGSLNPRTITYDPQAERVMVGECLSNFCGYAQLPAYEAIDQLTCHPAAKGDGDFSPDFFALGMIALFLLTGKKAFEKFNRDQVLEFRLEHGSCDAIVTHQLAGANLTLPPRLMVMLKGLLTDHKHDRWKYDDLKKWLQRQEVSAPISKMHKQAAVGIEFDGREYVSRKFFARDVFQKWSTAQKTVKVADVARWVNLGLKQPHIGEMLEKIYGASAQVQPVLSDERLARILLIIDPEGPIRFQQFSGHIHGLGSYLAWCYITSDRKGIQQVGTVLAEGMIGNWIDMQPNPRDYGFSMLGWSPSKLRQYVRKISLGFGMERCLYELNRTMPCQSALVQGFYCTTLKEMMEALERYPGNKAEQDPVDRHTGAFIASRVNLTEDIRIASLKNFPHVGKNPQALMVGLLTVAQSEARIAQLPKLSAWMEGRLATLIDHLHSKGIRRSMHNRIRQAVKEGKLSSLFKEISDPNYARRDLYGFHEARKQYRALGSEIVRRGKQSNIERTAYNIGLRISVVLAYLICAISALYAMIRG